MTTSGQATSSKLALSDSVLISTLKGETEVQKGGSLSAFEEKEAGGGPLDPAQCEGEWCH